MKAEQIFRIIRITCGTCWLYSNIEVHPRKGRESPDGEQRYSCILPLTSALGGGGYRRLGGYQGLSGTSRPTGIRSPDRPARSESLYRLSYPGPLDYAVLNLNNCAHVHINVYYFVISLPNVSVPHRLFSWMSFLEECIFNKCSIGVTHFSVNIWTPDRDVTQN
jgi:hypothetical protein